MTEQIERYRRKPCNICEAEMLTGKKVAENVPIVQNNQDRCEKYGHYKHTKDEIAKMDEYLRQLQRGSKENDNDIILLKALLKQIENTQAVLSYALERILG